MKYMKKHNTKQRCNYYAVRVHIGYIGGKERSTWVCGWNDFVLGFRNRNTALETVNDLNSSIRLYSGEVSKYYTIATISNCRRDLLYTHVLEVYSREDFFSKIY